MKKIIFIFYLLFVINCKLCAQEESLTMGLSINYGFFNKDPLKENYGFHPGIKGNVGYKTKHIGGYLIFDYLETKNKFSPEGVEENIKILISGLEVRVFIFKQLFIFLESGKLTVEESTNFPKTTYEVYDSWVHGGGIGYFFPLFKNMNGEIVIRFTESNKVELKNLNQKNSLGRNSISFGIFF